MVTKQKLTKLEQAGIIALIAAAACCFYVKKVYEPECGKFRTTVKKYSGLLEEIRILKWEQESNESIAVSIEEREKALKSEKDSFKKVSAILAGSEELLDVLTAINRLAKRHNLKVREFSPVPEKNKIREDRTIFLKRSFYDLIVAGGFLDFKEFLTEFKLLPKLVSCEKVTIERDGDEPDLKISLLLSI